MLLYSWASSRSGNAYKYVQYINSHHVCNNMKTEYNHITHTHTLSCIYCTFLSPLSPRQAVICSGHSWHRTHHRSSHINALFALMVAHAGGWTDAAHTHGWHGQPPGAPLAKEDGRRVKKSPCQFTLVALVVSDSKRVMLFFPRITLKIGKMIV